jgi:uncharacterized OB-fold protein
MDGIDPFEPESQIFVGTVKFWRSGYGELVTDSGVTVPLNIEGQPALRVGMRVRIVARKYKPRYFAESITAAD